jgi:SAM-dependent methyltransferase
VKVGCRLRDQALSQVPAEGVRMNSSSRATQLAEFYLRPVGDKANLFEIWEEGGARGDSVTPSTCSPEYRDWMRGKLISELERTGRRGLLSLGCGNAVIEADIARMGYPVLGVDALEEAVSIAQSKGVEALQADITQWRPEGSWSVVYMDGVLGHLYEPGMGLRHVIGRVYDWLASADSATLVASNDGTTNGEFAESAPSVNGFYWLSAEYMRVQAEEAGFNDISVEEFRYNRPLSGERIRSVIVAHTRT